jgi:hypothetical protein
MLHRHHDGGDEPSGHGQSGGGQHGEQLAGNVAGKRLLPGQYPPHPKVFTVQLHPEDGEAFLAEVRLDPDDDGREELYQPEPGGLRDFIFGQATGETHREVTDGRNSRTAHRARPKGLMSAVPQRQPAPEDASVTGRPRVAAAICPACGAKAGQAHQATKTEPACRFCRERLPARPRARLRPGPGR